jgi:hypothetical protein
MVEAESFAFSEVDQSLGVASCLPYLPLTLTHQGRLLEVSGLVDTGATVNVLPYDAGLQLGAIWEQQTTPVRLAFAWTQTNDHPLILGQVNFFLEFDVCFFRSQSVFEIKPKQSL